MRRYFKSIRSEVVLGICADGMRTASSAMLIYIQKSLFDSIKMGADIKLWEYMMMMTLSIGSIILFSYITMILSIKSRVKFEKNLKLDFFSKITEFSSEKFRKREIGEYVSIQGNDIKELTNLLVNGVVDLIKSINMFIIYGVVMIIFVNWKMAVVAVTLAGISSVVIPKITEERLEKRNKSFLDDMGKYSSRVMDLLHGFKLINSRTRDKFLKTHDESIKRNVKEEFRFKRVVAVANMLNSSSTYIINIVGIIMAAVLMYRNEISIGTAVASIGFINLFAEPVEIFIYAVNAYKSSRGIKNKVQKVLNYESKDLIEKGTFTDSIELKNITIKHEDFIMEDLSFKFSKGKKICTCGW